jgi:hypothetical protein
MQWSSFSGLSQDQTTWSVFVLWIIFNHFSIAKDFTSFLYTDTTNDGLINSMLGKLELPGLNFLSYLVDRAMLNLGPMRYSLVFALSWLTFWVRGAVRRVRLNPMVSFQF